MRAPEHLVHVEQLHRHRHARARAHHAPRAPPELRAAQQAAGGHPPPGTPGAPTSLPGGYDALPASTAALHPGVSRHATVAPALAASQLAAQAEYVLSSAICA